MKSAGKARSNGLYRHIRTSKEIIRNLLNDLCKSKKQRKKFSSFRPKKKKKGRKRKEKKRQNSQITKYTRNTIFYSFESEAKTEKFRSLLRLAFVVKSN